MKEGYIIRNQEKTHFITATSSAMSVRARIIDYADGKGIIEVALTDNPIVSVLNVNNVQKYEQY